MLSLNKAITCFCDNAFTSVDARYLKTSIKNAVVSFLRLTLSAKLKTHRPPTLKRSKLGRTRKHLEQWCACAACARGGGWRLKSPAFPHATSRRRCGLMQSRLPRALGKSVKGREVKPADGRSIHDRPGLYRPLSSSLPRALGLPAWLLGGSGARRRPLRLPGRLNSGLAGGKRCRGGGLVGRQGGVAERRSPSLGLG